MYKLIYILEFIAFIAYVFCLCLYLKVNNTDLLCYGIIFLLFEFKFNIDRTLYEIKSNKGNRQ